jgi:hypothetical protein
MANWIPIANHGAAVAYLWVVWHRQSLTGVFQLVSYPAVVCQMHLALDRCLQDHTSFVCQLAFPEATPKRPGVKHSFSPVTVVIPVSQPLSSDTTIVRPTLTDSTTMMALHKQLKSQHLEEWLPLIDRAGPLIELFSTMLPYTGRRSLHGLPRPLYHHTSNLGPIGQNSVIVLEFAPSDRQS